MQIIKIFYIYYLVVILNFPKDYSIFAKPKLDITFNLSTDINYNLIAVSLVVVLSMYSDLAKHNHNHNSG